MTRVRKKVVVHYRGTFDDGTEFENSYKQDKPVSFFLGDGMMIPSVEAAIATMDVGDKVSVHLEPEDAYGEYDPRRVEVFPKERVLDFENLSVGMEIMSSMDDGSTAYPVKVIKKYEDSLVVDTNHPLAGKTLNYDIELVSLTEIPPPGVPIRS